MSWRPAKCIVRLRDQVNEKAPHRLKASDGTIGDAAHRSRNSDHNAWVDDNGVGVVTAIDITHDPANGCDAQAIVDALVQSQDPRIKYIIWNRQILSSYIQPWVWRPYSGRNGHTVHFHLSVMPEKRLYDAIDLWRI